MCIRDSLMIGVPTALQSVMYNASNIVIQASINSFGTDAVAAWTAYGKMDIIFWMTITAMAQSITTFAGQNYGAGEYERLKKGVRVSVAMTACFTVLLSAAFFLLAQPLLAIFSPDPDVLEVGVDVYKRQSTALVTPAAVASPRPRPGRPAVTKKLSKRSWSMAMGAKQSCTRRCV